MFFGGGYVQRTMFVFIMCTILSLMLDGLWLGADDYGTMRTLTWFTSQGSGGWVFPLAGIGFLAALPQMLIWDYSFFHSLGAFGDLVRLVLSVIISIGFVWGFATMLWPIVANFVVTILRSAFGLITRFI